MSLDSPDANQAVLPVGAPDSLARPLSAGARVYCSGCDQDVTDTRKPHLVDRTLLSDRAAVDADVEEVPVFGWRCAACARVHALDPSGTDDHLGPGAGWLAVEATLASGGCGQVLVPQEVLLG